MEENTDFYRDLVWKPYSEWKGGQMAGFPPGAKGARLVHEELGFEVAILYHRSQIMNKEECMKLFTQFLKNIKANYDSN